MTLSSDERLLISAANEGIRNLTAKNKALRAENASLLHACRLIHRRHFVESGSLEMSEIDAELGVLGLRVWEW